MKSLNDRVRSAIAPFIDTMISSVTDTANDVADAIGTRVGSFFSGVGSFFDGIFGR